MRVLFSSPRSIFESERSRRFATASRFLVLFGESKRTSSGKAGRTPGLQPGKAHSCKKAKICDKTPNSAIPQTLFLTSAPNWGIIKRYTEQNPVTRSGPRTSAGRERGPPAASPFVRQRNPYRLRGLLSKGVSPVRLRRFFPNRYQKGFRAAGFYACKQSGTAVFAVSDVCQRRFFAFPQLFSQEYEV